MQLAGPDQRGEGIAGLKGRIELYERVGPQEPTVHLLPHEPMDALVADGQEAADVAAMVLNDALAEVEDVHGLHSLFWRASAGWWFTRLSALDSGIERTALEPLLPMLGAPRI